MVEASRADGSPGNVHNLVVRIPADDGEGVFPASDLRRELRVQALLDQAGVPVAPVIGIEEDPTVVGGPFLVTTRVEGRLIDSSAPYLSTGWLHDGSEEFQTNVVDSFLGVVADIHRCRSGASSRHRAVRRRSGGTRRCDRTLVRGTSNGPTRVVPHPLRSTMRLLGAGTNQAFIRAEAHPALGRRASLPTRYSQKTARRGGPRLRASAIGPAELDLGWFFCLHDMTVARCGEDLPGFCPTVGDRSKSTRIVSGDRSQISSGTRYSPPCAPPRSSSGWRRCLAEGDRMCRGWPVPTRRSTTSRSASADYIRDHIRRRNLRRVQTHVRMLAGHDALQIAPPDTSADGVPYLDDAIAQLMQARSHV